MAHADEAGVPDSLRALFWEDATVLAIRRIHDLADYGVVTAPEPVLVPQELVRFFFDGIVHVYNARALSQRDSVFALRPVHQVHAHQDPYPYWFFFEGRNTEFWVQALASGAPQSGNAAVDSLVALHDLTVSVSAQYADVTVFRLASSVPLNLRPLMRAFSVIEGVRSVRHQLFVGGGWSDITAVLEAPGVGFRFRLAWGDCPSGCYLSRTWAFVVEYDGRVRFARSEGRDQVPASFYEP